MLKRGTKWFGPLRKFRVGMRVIAEQAL